MLDQEIIRLENFFLYYSKVQQKRVEALSDINIVINKGEQIANICVKSTLKNVNKSTQPKLAK